MTYIKEYWEDKSKRIELANEHTKQMEAKYNKAISECIKNTTIYDTCIEEFHSKSSKTPTAIEVVDMDTVKAGHHYSYSTFGKIALLNFASYKEPGGMFLEGSKAQEECLCHASYLYNVLREQKAFYDWNNQHKNKGLYLNRALYSPDIVFEYDNRIFKCDIITCAAPNKSVAQKYQNVTDAENYNALKQRIQFVLDIAAYNKVNTLILGAYGCGVFGQNPSEVARIFKELLMTTHQNVFEYIIFAIPNGKNQNLKVFQQIFNVPKKLEVVYEEFPEENIRVLTVSQDNTALNMFYGDEAEELYNTLLTIKE